MGQSCGIAPDYFLHALSHRVGTYVCPCEVVICTKITES